MMIKPMVKLGKLIDVPVSLGGIISDVFQTSNNAH